MPVHSGTQPQVVNSNDSSPGGIRIVSGEAPKGRRKSSCFHHLSNSPLGEASFNAFALGLSPGDFIRLVTISSCVLQKTRDEHLAIGEKRCQMQ